MSKAAPDVCPNTTTAIATFSSLRRMTRERREQDAACQRAVAQETASRLSPHYTLIPAAHFRPPVLWCSLVSSEGRNEGRVQLCLAAARAAAVCISCRNAISVPVAHTTKQLFTVNGATSRSGGAAEPDDEDEAAAKDMLHFIGNDVAVSILQCVHCYVWHPLPMRLRPGRASCLGGGDNAYTSRAVGVFAEDASGVSCWRKARAVIANSQQAAMKWLSRFPLPDQAAANASTTTTATTAAAEGSASSAVAAGAKKDKKSAKHHRHNAAKAAAWAAREASEKKKASLQDVVVLQAAMVDLLLLSSSAIRRLDVPFAGNNANLKSTLRSTLTNLTHFSISARSMTTLTPLTSCKKLRVIDAPECAIGTQGTEGLETLPELRRLTLCANPLDRMPCLGSLPALEELDVTDCRWLTTLAGVSQVFSLDTLRAARTSIDDITELSRCRRLRVLDIGYSRVDKLKGLTSLSREPWTLSHLSVNGIPGIAAEEFAHVACLDMNHPWVEAQRQHRAAQLPKLNAFDDVIEVSEC